MSRLDSSGVDNLKNLRIFCALFLIYALNFLAAHACSCGCEVLGSFGVGGPIITMPAYTLPKGKFVINSSLRYQNVNASGVDLAFLTANNIHGHTHDSEMQLTANMAYGVTDDLNVILSYPYRFLNGIKSAVDGEIIDGGNSIGLGDMTLTAKYRFLYRSRFQAAALAGIKMPTGQTNERDEFGYKLGADEQPGTGSWDPIMGLAVSMPVRNFSFDSSVIYRLSTPGVQNTIVGDQVNFNNAVTYNFQAHKFLGQEIKTAAVLELNGIWQEKVEYLGTKDDSHGGLIMFLSPGLRIAVNENTVANFLIGFPIISDLNGFQPDTGIQLFTGISRVF